MAGSAVLLYIGIRLEEDNSLDLNLFKRQKKRTRSYNSGEFEGSSNQAKELR
jgi:hypothetical protein